MFMEFTSWDAGLHTSDPNSLEHYGVLGQKWACGIIRIRMAR